MIKTLRLELKSDLWGSMASALCLVHCLATPFLFAAHAGHVHGHNSHPIWWGTIDMLFIGISFVAVFWSAKHSSKRWMQYALWVGWALLAFVIINEKLALIHLAEAAIYFPSIALVVLHLWNKKYCRCEEEACCD